MDVRRGVAVAVVGLVVLAGATGCSSDDDRPTAAEVAARDRELQAEPIGDAQVPEQWPSELDPPEEMRLSSTSLIEDPKLVLNAAGNIEGEVDGIYEDLKAQLAEAGYTTDDESSGENDAGPTRQIDATGPEWTVVIKVFETGNGYDDWVGVTWIVSAV